MKFQHGLCRWKAAGRLYRPSEPATLPVWRRRRLLDTEVVPKGVTIATCSATSPPEAAKRLRRERWSALLNIGGWSLYGKNGKLKYCYNVAGVHHFYIEATRALPPGEHQVRMKFAYAGGGLGKGGQIKLYVDGGKVGEGAIPMTQAMVFSADDGCDVGEDSGAPVSQDYGSRGNAFNGTVKGVQLAIGEAAESSDHLVSPEQAIRIAMARQ